MVLVISKDFAKSLQKQAFKLMVLLVRWKQSEIRCVNFTGTKNTFKNQFVFFTIEFNEPLNVLFLLSFVISLINWIFSKYQIVFFILCFYWLDFLHFVVKDLLQNLPRINPTLFILLLAEFNFNSEFLVAQFRLKRTS